MPRRFQGNKVPQGQVPEGLDTTGGMISGGAWAMVLTVVLFFLAGFAGWLAKRNRQRPGAVVACLVVVLGAWAGLHALFGGRFQFEVSIHGLVALGASWAFGLFWWLTNWAHWSKWVDNGVAIGAFVLSFVFIHPLMPGGSWYGSPSWWFLIPLSCWTLADAIRDPAPGAGGRLRWLLTIFWWGVALPVLGFFE